MKQGASLCNTFRGKCVGEWSLTYQVKPDVIGIYKLFECSPNIQEAGYHAGRTHRKCGLLLVWNTFKFSMSLPAQ